jgi:hypothetical protein
MPKDKLTDYDATAANNTDVGGISVDEGMLPSNVNNAIREVMSHLKDFAAGTEAVDAIEVTGDLTVDTDLLFVDASGNAVGIGDATPESITNYNILSVGSSTSKRGVINASNGTAVASLWTTDANLARVGSRSNHDVSFERNGSEMWKLTSSGHLKAASNGYGIDFSASEGSGASSSVLDDYEKGTWTPTLTNTGTAPSVTYNARDGEYVKIGNLVHISCHISLTAYTAGSGNARISGLPYTINMSTVSYGSGAVGYAGNFNKTPRGVLFPNSTTLMRLYRYNGSDAQNDQVNQEVPATGFGSASDVYFFGSYYTNS